MTSLHDMTSLQRVAPILALSLLLQACGSTSLHGKNRQSLEAGARQVAAMKVGPATKELEVVVARTSSDPGEYALQRFYAALLLSEVHLAAALADPFMTAPGTMTRDVKADSVGLAHLVAAAYYGGFARDEESSAAKKAGSAAQQLPGELAERSVEEASKQLDLARLITFTRLGFQTEVADLFAGAPELLDLDTCEQALGDAKVSKSVRPWVLWSAFQFQRTRDEPRAYRLGVRAREAGRDPESSFGEARGQEIVDWIMNDSKYRFVSSAGIAFDPGTDFCTQTGESNVEFRAEPKNGQ